MASNRFIFSMTASMIICLVASSFIYLMQSGQPSADVIARQNAQTPIINVADFEPGDVEILTLDTLPIVVWRRSEEDMALAASQNAPPEWREDTSRVMGRNNRLYASDENLTLEGEWFFAVAYDAERSGFHHAVMLGTGDFGGFFEPYYGAHFDLTGRVRKGYPSDNLTVVMGQYSDDRSTIQLDLRR